jgi:hypothetical protein
MGLPENWNDLDRAIWRARKSSAEMPNVFRALLAAEMDVLMPYQTELEGEMIKIENGAPFPFALFDGEKRQFVMAFSCGERSEEGIRAGKVPNDTFLTGVVNGRDLCEMIGAMKFDLVINRSCQTGELKLNDELLRDLAKGLVLQASTSEPNTERLTFYSIDPADYPTSVVQAAFEKMRQHSAFRAGWMLAQRTDHGPVYCLAALINPESEQLRHELNLIVQLARPNTAMELNVIALDLSDPENVIGAFRQFPVTFYLAPGFDPKKPLD